MEDGTVIQGACLCGGVTFEIETPTRFCAHCHCSMCRRAHGAALVTWNGVPYERFRMTSGEELLTRYQSSEAATRSFCSRCGSSLFFESSRWGGEVHIATAALQGTDRPPAVHVFFSDRADWFDPTQELPRMGGESGTEPLGT